MVVERTQINAIGPAMQSALDAKVAKAALPLDVRDYGAVGDGTTDDRAAIQAAIDVAVTGQTVFFPPKVYAVGLSSSHGLIVKAGIRLHGPGAAIKIKSGVGSWYSFICGANPGTDMTGFSIDDITLDANYTGNPLVTAASLGATPRFLVALNQGTDITLRRVKVTGHTGTNTLYLSGAGMRRIEVLDCQFLDMGNAPATEGHDHSTIYIGATSAAVRGCTFEAASPLGGHAAIETHAPQTVVTGNRVEKYSIGLNITGVQATDGDNMVVTGNVMRNVMSGVALYSMSTLGGPAPGIRNLDLSGNEITIDRDYHLPYGDETLVRVAIGIYLAPTSDLPVENVSIRDNQVHVKPYTLTALVAEDLGCGVAFHRTVTATGPDLNLVITGNTLVNMLGPGIRVSGSTTKRLRILDNTVIDPGGSGSGMASAFKCGVFLSGTFEDVELARDMIVDTRATHLITNGVEASTVTSVTNGRVVNSPTRCTDGVSLSGFNPASGTGKAFWLDHEMDTWSALASPIKPGSRIRARDTGTLYVNTMVTDGTAPVFVDVRTPLAHAASHALGGTDPLAQGGFTTGLFTTNRYYAAPSASRTTSAVVNGDGCAVATPFWVGKTTSFDRIGVSITTLAAGSAVRLGIYADNGFGSPGSRVLDAGTIDSTTTGAKEVTIAQSLVAGLYWLVAVPQGGSPTFAALSGPLAPVGGGSLASITGAGGVYTGNVTAAAAVTGALPTPFPAVTGYQAFSPVIAMRAA